MKERSLIELKIQRLFDNQEYRKFILDLLKKLKIRETHIDFLIDTVMMNPNVLFRPRKNLSILELDFTAGIKKYALDNNKQVILNSVTRNGLNIKLASQKLKNSEEIVKRAISNNGLALEYASKKLKDNKELVLLAIKNNPDSYYFAGLNLKNDPKIIKSVLVREPSYIPKFEYLQKFNDLVKAVIKENGLALEYATSKLKNNKKVVQMAAKENIKALSFASFDLKNDEGFIIETAKKLKSDQVIYYASEFLLSNKEFYIDIIEKIGFNLYFVKDEFKDDLEVVEVAIKKDIRNLEHASNRLKENEIFILHLIKKYGPILRYASKSLLEDKDFMIKAIKTYNGSIKYANESLYNNKLFIKEVSSIDNWCKLYISNLKKIK
ncbi:MAG: DUF4116 domain-containing protein [Bacilli bacterium]